MPQQITGDDVWSAVLNDPSFAAEMSEESLREVVKPFIIASPEILATFLDQPVSLKVLADTKIVFLRYCIANGFAKQMAAVMPIMDEDSIKGLLEGVIEMFEEFTNDLPAMLAEQGITEAEVMMSPRVGLSTPNQDAYQSGTLTVSDVLRTQPAVILQSKS